MENEMKNEQAVSPVIATILMVAITVVLAGVLYVWANSLASDQPDTGTRNNFKADDSSAMISTGTDDNLMKLRWIDAKDDLNWAFVSMKLEVGDNTFTCSVQDGEDCSITQTGSDDGVWENDEFVYLHENGANICGDDVSCSVSIYVQYSGSTVVGTSSIALS